MPPFGVIVCPKCREHAQILELACAKKTRCQKCGASLEVRKLRVLFSSDSLEEAVSARTLLQARVHKLDGEMESALAGEGKKITVTKKETEAPPVVLQDKRPPPKRSPVQVILQLLRSNGGEMETGSLISLAKEQGIDEQKLEAILEKLKSTGEIYEPFTGKLCLA
jgi:DNA replicative helicase MCM subunit Mcm2 (Cdc46/Mcm family)